MMDDRTGSSDGYSCDARSRIASCGARARSRTVEFSVHGVI